MGSGCLLYLCGRRPAPGKKSAKEILQQNLCPYFGAAHWRGVYVALSLLAPPNLPVAPGPSPSPKPACRSCCPPNLSAAPAPPQLTCPSSLSVTHHESPPNPCPICACSLVVFVALALLTNMAEVCWDMGGKEGCRAAIYCAGLGIWHARR